LRLLGCSTKVNLRVIGNSTSMSDKLTAMKAKATEARRKAKANDVAIKAAVTESERIRAMFDEDRAKLQKRYGIVSAIS